jgi:AcrR family transcriptional regulator
MGHKGASDKPAGVDHPAGERADTPGNGAAPRGRPRDVEVDHRILSAGRHIYLHRGWSGFNFDVVAKAAGVSKDAIYRRYRSRRQLLVASLNTGGGFPSDLAQGSDLRAALIHVARECLDRWLDPEGFLLLRVFVESASNPELAEAYHGQVALVHVRYRRHAVRQAIDDGRLASIAGPTAFIDALLGGLLMHVIATPPDLREQMKAKADRFVVDHVDLLLRGAGYRDRSAPPSR